MTASSTLPAPNLMPLMRYRDLAEAMSWLEQAFEFEKQIAVSDSDGAVIYGQMSYRGGLMMMGAVRDTDLDKLMRQPDEVGGVETQSCYLVVDDADAHYARAQSSGADIVLEIKSDGLGRRGYSCRDPEGHIWNFGTYNPGRGMHMPAAVAEPASAVAPEPAPRRARKLMGLVALLGLGAASWWFAGDIRAEFIQRMADGANAQSAARAEQAYAELVKVRAEKRKADDVALELSKTLEAERARVKQIESQSHSGADKVAEAEKARMAAEENVTSLKEELKRERLALEAAIEAKRVSEEKLAVRAAAAATTPPAAPQVQAQPAQPPSETQAALAPEQKSAIETSANKPSDSSASGKADAASETPSRSLTDDDDTSDDRADKKTQKVTGRAARTSSPKPRSVSPHKLPAYHVDVRNVWPYNGWSN
ncbi:VOC family protein [Hyphomicrobium sp.]|uniref:VOC family protein n=1 Tax=Hyphomicrobium sp. TaxID=82 RepID=UPI003F6E6A80